MSDVALEAERRLDAGTRPAPTGRLRRVVAQGALGLMLPLSVGIGWELAAANGLVAVNLLPPPSAILRVLGDLLASGDLVVHVGATLGRVLFGFACGALAATALGALTGYADTARRLLDPTLQALRSIPSIAWVPLFILWFGIFETSKVLLIAVGTFFPVYLALVAGIRGVDRKLIEVGRVLRFGHARMVGRILLPAVLPTWLIGLRGGLGLGWMFVVAAEFMGASEGLGYLLIDGQQTGRAAAILASILSFAVLGKLTDAILVATGRRFVAWQDSVDTVR